LERPLARLGCADCIRFSVRAQPRLLVTAFEFGFVYTRRTCSGS
jgi:hypothetical protein